MHSWGLFALFALGSLLLLILWIYWMRVGNKNNTIAAGGVTAILLLIPTFVIFINILTDGHRSASIFELIIAALYLFFMDIIGTLILNSRKSSSRV